MQPSALGRLAARVLGRVRAKAWHSVGFALLGTAIAALTMVPNWLPFMNEFSTRDISPNWWREVGSLLLGALLVTFALRVFADKGAQLAERPAMFCVLLCAGGAAATLLMWSILAQMKHKHLTDILVGEILNTWWQTLLWGGLVGWLYVLNLRRTEDQEQLGALSLRRAMLARELARSRLGTARAQIDPAMVARILREVHRRYHERPDAAAALLEHLISYLRLAMQRVKLAAPSVAAEGALVRAFVALREAEQGVPIACTLALNEEVAAPSAPLFLLVHALLDAAMPARPRAMELDCAWLGGRARVSLALRGKGIDASERERLAAALAHLLPGVPDPLQCIIEPGVNIYVVDCAAR
ncbi:MAG: hypothetical protein V4582_08295 [Pseudomonadota bacterium]